MVVELNIQVLVCKVTSCEGWWSWKAEWTLGTRTNWTLESSTKNYGAYSYESTVSKKSSVPLFLSIWTWFLTISVSTSYFPSLKLWKYSLFQTWTSQATVGRKIKFKVYKKIKLKPFHFVNNVCTIFIFWTRRSMCRIVYSMNGF